MKNGVGFLQYDIGQTSMSMLSSYDGDRLIRAGQGEGLTYF